MRKVSQGRAEQKVDNAVDGLKAIAAKASRSTTTARSGPCDFTDIGDIQDCKFRYEQVQDGKIALVKIA